MTKETCILHDVGAIGNELLDLQLFVRDFLLERSIFESFGFESLYENKVLTAIHWQDMQYRSIHEDIDDLEECVGLVAAPETENSDDTPHPLQVDPLIESKLQRAIRERSYQAVISLLAENFNLVDYALLKTAIEFFEPSIFDLLLCRHTTVNSEKHQDLTNLLYFAAQCGYIRAIEPLLQYGANIEGESTFASASPLTGAVSSGHFEVVRYLVEKGANIGGNGYKSPISSAIKHGHMEIVVYLAKKGAYISKDDRKNILLHVSQVSQIDTTLRKKKLFIAARDSQRKCFEFLLLCARMDAASKKQLIVEAAKCHEFEIVNQLLCDELDGNFDSYEKTISSSMTPSHMSSSLEKELLSFAAEDGNTGIFEYMTSHGVDFRKGDYSKELLFIAIESNNFHIVKYLLDRSPNLITTTKETLMSFAMKHRDLRTVDYLFQLGTDINMDDLLREFSSNYTWNIDLNVYESPEGELLYLAAESGCLGIVQYLISHGGNVNAKRCKARDYFHVFASCIDEMVDESTLIGVAAKKGHLDIVKYLLNQGTVLSEDLEKGLLYIATKTGDFALFQRLFNFVTILSTGWDKKLLCLAAKYGHLDIVKYLMTLGIDVNEDPMNPITHPCNRGCAFFLSSDCYCDLWRFPDLPNIPRSISLYLAAERGHFDVFKYLLDHGAHISPYDDSILCVSLENGHHRITDYLVSRGQNHSGIAAIIARERCQLGRQLITKLQKAHQRLTDESCNGSASADFASFTAQLGTCESLWRKGIAVIRNLMDGHLPSELMDIVSCLLVANAMRSTVSDTSRLCSKKE